MAGADTGEVKNDRAACNLRVKFAQEHLSDRHTFSAVWLCSSVVSVLISVTTDMSPTGDSHVTTIFCGEMFPRACSGTLKRRAGTARCQVRRALWGNICGCMRGNNGRRGLDPPTPWNSRRKCGHVKGSDMELIAEDGVKRCLGHPRRLVLPVGPRWPLKLLG